MSRWITAERQCLYERALHELPLIPGLRRPEVGLDGQVIWVSREQMTRRSAPYDQVYWNTYRALPEEDADIVETVRTMRESVAEAWTKYTR